MAEFVIIPDCACDLNAELRERFGCVDYLKGIVYFPDGHSESADMDWTDEQFKAYFDSMSNKKAIYKTAYAPTGEMIATFENQFKAGKDVLCVTLSGALSGTYQACMKIGAQLMEQYPERKMICVDSLRYSAGMSVLIALAAQKKAEGASLEETAAFLEANKHRGHQIGFMDDLFFLCRTGRISNFKAFFGTLVGVNPLADFNRNGMSEVLGKTKGKKAALNATIEYMRKTIENPQDQIVFIAHSNRPAAAALLKDMVIQEFNPKDVVVCHIGTSCGASIGPGLCAAYYVGTELSEGMVNEKAIMDEILKS